MKRFFLGCCLMPLCLFTSSCQLFVPRPVTPGVPGNNPGVAQSDAENRIREATTMIKNGMLDDAEKTIAPLLGGTIMLDEVARLTEEISRRRAQAATSLSPELSGAKAMAEVNERLRLPTSYGRTVTIAKDSNPFDLPPGPMEELINRKVSMHLDNAKVKTIISALNQIDGLNIIADNALTDGGDGAPALTVQVEQVPLREVLSYIARNMGIAFHLSENVIWVTKSEDDATSGPELETRIYRLRRGFIPDATGGGGAGGGGNVGMGGGAAAGGGDDEMDEALKEFLGQGPEGASYRIFKNRNLLVIKNTRANLRKAEEIIREFDREPLQVLIEARFVSLKQKDLKELGTKITNLRKTRDGRDDLVNVFNANTNIPTPAVTAAATTVNLAGIIGNLDYRIVISALDQMNIATNLSAPRLTVLNNQTAHIHKGQNMYYWEEWDATSTGQETLPNGASTSTATPIPSGAPTELQLGITLDVSVNIGNDGKTIMMRLDPSITSLVSFFTYGTNQSPLPVVGDDQNDEADTNIGYQLPVIADNSLSTAVAVNSGDTVVLGGTLETTVQDDLEQVPWLGRLPVVGWLFKRKSVSKEPQHLLIFVTATVVGKSGEFIQVQE